MKNKIIYALILAMLLIFSSCTASEPVLRTNSEMQSEMDGREFSGGGEYAPVGKNIDCQNGHIGKYTAGNDGCIKVCSRCGEVLEDEIPHIPKRTPRGYLVIGGISYEQFYLTCEKCGVIYEKEYIPFDVRSKK